ISVLLTVALMFIWVNRIRLRKKESELKAVQQLQKEKERIARDLHDNVGGQLSYIIYSLDGINEENKERRTEITDSINQSVRSVIGNLRETIWAISDANIKLQDFSDRLKVYARNLFKHTNAVVKYNEEINTERELNALLGLNLYRICQEILTNAFKHSHADEITIDLKTDGDKFIIKITDNGVGFDMSQKKEECYGLQNARKRSGEFGITLSLHSEIKRGTQYDLMV
ncbi:MAG TPA: ATP-binding protein, partial [Arachidicoccus sp.]